MPIYILHFDYFGSRTRNWFDFGAFSLELIYAGILYASYLFGLLICGEWLLDLLSFAHLSEHNGLWFIFFFSFHIVYNLFSRIS